MSPLALHPSGAGNIRCTHPIFSRHDSRPCARYWPTLVSAVQSSSLMLLLCTCAQLHNYDVNKQLYFLSVKLICHIAFNCVVGSLIINGSFAAAQCVPRRAKQFLCHHSGAMLLPPRHCNMCPLQGAVLNFSSTSIWLDAYASCAMALHTRDEIYLDLFINFYNQKCVLVRLLSHEVHAGVQTDCAHQ